MSEISKEFVVGYALRLILCRRIKLSLSYWYWG